MANFELQILHAADQEAGIPALDDAPRFSAVLNALKDDYANTLILSSGDAYIPGIFLDASADTSLATLLGKEGEGRGDIAIQNELGFQAIALGNHEFDLGTEFVASVVAPDGAYTGTNFPYLSSNLDFSGDANLSPLVVADGQEASSIPGKIAGNTIVTVNGEKIGVVGATTPTLASISSPGDVVVNPADSTDIDALAAEIQASVDSLLAANPDINKVVLLSHMQQIAIEEELATKLKNVDVIMAGGSNTLLSDSTDRLRDGDSSEGAYPILKTDADGKPVAVINTDGNYKYVGRLVVEFDDNGEIVPTSIDPNISGAYATDEAGVTAVGGTPDPEIVAITDALRDVIVDLESNFFGVTDTFLNGTRGSVRTEETNLGNLTADANLAIAKQTDPSVMVSIKNGGGIRDDIGRVVTPPGATEPQFLPPEGNELAGKPEGGISQVDIQDSLRFNNGLTLLTATAEELLAIIEHGVSESADGATPGRFPQISGLKFSFDKDLPAGDRVQSLAVVDEDGFIVDVIAENGELQGDANREIRLVTLSFLAGGGDSYPFPQRDVVQLAQEDDAIRTGAATFAENGSEQDALAEYLAANFSEENPFSMEDVAPAEDMRIQNLDFREDTVLVPETFTLQLLHTADQEAGIPALEDAPNFSAVLNALKSEDADSDGNADYENTLLLSSGDAYIPGIFLDASADPSLAPLLGKEGVGRSDIIIQNELGFQAIALGNHEFDLGTGFIADVISPDGAYPGANFPYLSSNLDASTDANLAPLVTADGQEASDIPGKIAGNTVVTVNGEKIGVVGATTPTLGSISSPGDVTVKPMDSADIDALAAEIQASVDSLLAANPDINKVVLLSHMQQIAIEEELAGLLKNVDIIMAGGSNTLLSDDTDTLRDGDTSEGAYPIIKTDADGKPVAVVNTDGNYKYVGRLVVDFDARGEIITDSIDPNVSGAYATDDAGVAAVNGTPDPEIVAITDALSNVITDLESNFFGITNTFLNGTRGSVRTEETNLGNLTADANLATAKAADDSVVISIKNGGGIRDNIGRVVTPPGATEPQFLPPEGNELAGKPEGGISQVDIQDSLRFNNGLTLLTATAEELLAIIEHGVSESADGATPGRFPQVSGLKFSFDKDLPAGDRVQSLAVVDENDEIIDIIARDGELQGDSSRTFRLVTLNFLAGGGDGYPFPQRDVVELAQAEDAPRTGAATFAEDGSEQDALAEFLAANFSEENPFSEEDVAPELDMRIQNLDFREDTVLPVLPPVVTADVDGTTVEAIDLTGFDNQATVMVDYTISREAAFDNEVYFYAVDDINGAVNGVQVGDEGYLEAAMKNLVSPEFSTSNNNTENGTLEFNSGSIVVPVIIADGTFAEAISGAAEVYFPYLGANTDNGTFDHIRFNDATNSFEFEDLANGGDQDFNDIVIKINSIA